MPAMARRIAPRAGPSCAAEATQLGARVKRGVRVERGVRVVGIDVDAQTRCVHYHSPLDVVALKFKCCGVWHPCIDCHRALADHAPLPWPMAERSAEAVLCGMCGSRMSIAAYLDCANACPHCGAAFNPGCAAHHHLYFEMQEPSAGEREGKPLARKQPQPGSARGCPSRRVMAEDRVAVDIGGTFTDVVLEHDGRHVSTKVLTTHAEPAAGALQGLRQVLQRAQRKPEHVGVVLHGTTLATNAIIERRGARTALVTTQGHRDVLEMAFENRFEQYDVNIDRPEPLVPRPWRLPVAERMNGAGEVLIPLAAEAVQALVPTLRQERIESVAVGFLHGYANPAHERLVRDVLADALPRLSITLASEVCPEIREFERFSTACANAYVKPLMSRYLADMQQRLAALGVACPFLMMTSGGGLASLRTAREFPIRLVESGPAGGAILAARIAQDRGLARVVSLDMGGTTAKVCLIDDGMPQESRAFEVARSYRFRKGSGLPVRIPVIEMVEIGAGGGSIASVDGVGRLQVGPRSAGSAPGPACYGNGGANATVTDADLLQGRLHPERFAGGAIALDVDAAQDAIGRDVVAPWQGAELTVDEAARAMGEVVDENMAAAARAHAAEWGKDMAGRTLIAFGGAAPLHAARIAEKLALDAVLVPPAAGVGSAMGFLAAPVAFEVVRSRHMRLSALQPAEVAAVMAEMRAEAHAVVGAVASGDLAETRRAYMRYLGQGFEIAVEAPDSLTAEALREAFDTAYEALYGRLIEGLDVEVLSWTLTLRAPMPPLSLAPTAPLSLAESPSRCGETPSRIDRESLAPADRLAGPCAIVEDQTVTIVPAGFEAQIDAARNVLLVRRNPAQEAGAGIAPGAAATR